MIALLLFGLVGSYLSFSLFGAWRGEAPLYFYGAVLGLTILFLSQAWLFYLFFQSDSDTKLRFEKPLQKFAFLSMGIISFLFTFTFLRDLGAFLFQSFFDVTRLYSTPAILVILALTGICFLWGSFNARFRVTTPRIRIPVKDLPPELEGLCLVQLSDVHLGTGPTLSQVRSLMDRALALSPDLIFLTGDIIDGAPPELKSELSELARLKAKYGVYFVLGNHECYWNHTHALQAIRSAGITPLLNEGVSLTIAGKKVYIAGVNDPAMTHFKGEGPVIPDPDPTSSLRILLAHQPQIAKKVAELPYHLQLSGHTHGGQFFPWNLVVKRIYLHPGGLGKLKDLWVYVSHGTGFWGPPLRLGTDGEVTRIEMVRMNS